MRLKLSEAERAQVTAAVSAAERRTDGEIVTIVSDRSDAYHDVALHYALAAMLAVLGLCAAFPAQYEAALIWVQGGWVATPSLREALFAPLIAQALIFLIVRYALAWTPLRMKLTPGATKARRVRRRAVRLFRASAENRTEGHVGILLYLSLAEHRAEIIGDAAIVAKVKPESWGDAMVALIDGLRRKDPAGGMANAVAQIALVLEQHFPKSAGNPNELPDRLIEL